MNETVKQARYGFVPGCSLASYNPRWVEKTGEYLKEVLPDLSLILKCCGKPTRDIGQQQLFEERFDGTRRDIREAGIERMILACPNCKKLFDQESDTTNLSLWELFPMVGIPEEMRNKGADSDVVFVIHDPCSARMDQRLCQGVRWLLGELGYRYVESEYRGEHTLCCGFGGQVRPAEPRMAERVMARRLETLGNYPVATCCATCRSAFAQAHVPAWHLLDLLWGPVVYASDVPPEDVLALPENVWHNRFLARKKLTDFP